MGEWGEGIEKGGVRQSKGETGINGRGGWNGKWDKVEIEMNFI
jgi:hypothetical protein